jgi:pyruvate dehydrogenase E2 component (dihydrolipoamide acetyltransferase)
MILKRRDRMPTPIVVPKATISMEHGTILQWARRVGDPIAKDETLLELETDKAIVELPAPADGVLLGILLESGEVNVDQVIGWIGQPGEKVPEKALASSKAPARTSNSEIEQNSPNTISGPPLAATPAARRRAKELGIELKAVQGTGPGGRITEGDIENQALAKSAVSGTGRRALAEHVTEAWRNVPHIHIVRAIDVGSLVRTKSDFSSQGCPVSYSDLVLFTVAKTLTCFTQLLPPTEAGGANLSIAFAVDTEHGVVTPAIPGGDTLSLRRLADTRQKLTSLAKARKLQPEHLRPASFTVTNLGMFGVDLFAPIINTPQIAILALGQIAQQAVVENGQVRAGWRMWATLAADHRHIDGALAAKFLAAWQDEINRLPEGVTSIS